MGNAADNVIDTTNTTDGQTSGTYTGTTDARPDLDKQLKEAQAAIVAAQEEATNWRSRFTGLQGKYQSEQKKWSEDSAKLMELDEQLKRVAGDHESTVVTLKDAQEKLDTAESERDILQSQLERLSIITTEFPHLTPFLKDDLVPDGTGDELREKLKLFTGKLEEVKKGKIADVALGASADDTPPAKPGTASSILKEAIAALQKGELKEYDALYSQYIDLSKSGG